jgi:hypothetical protein
MSYKLGFLFLENNWIKDSIILECLLPNEIRNLS